MSKTADNMIVIERALQVLPADLRDEYRGQAWLKAQQLLELPQEEQEQKISDHVRYLQRRDRRGADGIPLNESIPDSETPDPSAVAGQREVIAHELAKLSPLDRQIVLMIAASHSFREIGQRLQLSPATICKRLQRIRQNAGGCA